MNEVPLCHMQLVLGWVTAFGQVTTSVCNQPTRSIQPCIPQGSLNRVLAALGCGKDEYLTSLYLYLYL